MKNATLKNLTHAHAWIGLIISGVLMTVFICGSISMFRENILFWEYSDELKLQQGSTLTPVQIVEKVRSEFTIPADADVFVNFPSERSPLYSAFFRYVDPSKGEEGTLTRVNVFFDPVSGDILFRDDEYRLSNFLYVLHVNLNIPYGNYIVGVVCLFFLVALFTGVLIHWRKLFSHFFQYRKDKSKDKWLDGHNLIGVTALPFNLMFAITGALFNIGILFQIGFVMGVYGGDLDKLANDAGYPHYHVENSGEPMQLSKLDSAFKLAEADLNGYTLTNMTLHHMNDKSAILELRGKNPALLNRDASVQYRIDSGEHLITIDNESKPSLGAGMNIFSVLHFGDFGGTTLRLVYFLLGLATCYLILTGNLIWIEKRMANRKQSAIGMRFVQAMTTSITAGGLLAVAACFSWTRLLTFENSIRWEALPYVFSLTMLICLVFSYFVSQPRQATVQTLRLSGLLFLVCPVIDLYRMLQGRYQLSDYNAFELILVNAVLLICTVFCFVVAKNVLNKPVLSAEKVNPIKSEVLSTPA